MQFLWKYVDDLIGKGLEWYVVAELLLYASASLVPLALPMAILLSSIMTFGNLGEHYELVAMKSSGLSLQRIMRPLVVFIIFISVSAFFFSNNLLPLANLKMGTLLYDITHQKPAIEIREGIFYNGIDGYSIRVGRKENDGNLLKDILIYDHTDRTGNSKVIVAESGTMKMSDNKQFMILNLYNGYSYDEQYHEHKNDFNFPLLRAKYREQVIRMDLSGFQFSRSDEEIFKDNYQMLNLNQLSEAIIEMKENDNKRRSEFKEHLNENYYRNRPRTDSIFDFHKETKDLKPVFFEDFSITEKKQIMETSMNLARSVKSYSETFVMDYANRSKFIYRHEVEWHRKLTLPFACVILFFIGAPLGAIIRKGGLGMPVVMSFIFFIIFHVITISGEKFVKEGVMEAWGGMWLASIILLPVGVFLTYKAANDSVIFDIGFYKNIFNFLKRKEKIVAPSPAV
jgi:lipopolysaccharide export system permease protein